MVRRVTFENRITSGTEKYSVGRDNNLKIIASSGNDKIAEVFAAETASGKAIEFVESCQPPIPREEKWVLIVSTLCGCPVECVFCDAGGSYKSKLTKEEIFSQIDFLVTRRYPSRTVPVRKFKIQFARVGEPAFNDGVIEVLDEFHTRYDAPGFLPSVSTVAPRGRDEFFEKLLDVKEKRYRGRFQLQFSLHTTDEKLRDEIIPTPKWDFRKIAGYSEKFFRTGDKKVTLNFALADNYIFDTTVLREYFDPRVFFIKITPVNPTRKSLSKGINSLLKEGTDNKSIIENLESLGYEALLSYGESEENKIGSNCGMFLSGGRERE